MGFAMAFPMAIKVEGGVNDPRLGPIDVRSKCRTCDEGGASVERVASKWCKSSKSPRDYHGLLMFIGFYIGLFITMNWFIYLNVQNSNVAVFCVFFARFRSHV